MSTPSRHQAFDSQALPSQLLMRALSGSVLVLLLFTVLAGTSEQLHSQMLKLGAYLWEDYFILRTDIQTPDCEINIDIPQRITQLRAEFDQDNQEFDLLGDTFDEEAAKNSLLNQQEICVEKHHKARTYSEKIDLPVRFFRALEHGFSNISLFAINQQKLTLICLLLVALTITTIKKEHIAFRLIKTRKDHYISTSAQLIGNASLAISTWAYYQGSSASGIEIANPELLILLLTGSSCLVIINSYQLIRAPAQLKTGGTGLRALLTVPIYTYMLLAATNHFFLKEQHLSGIAIYVTQIFQLTGLYLKIALYIWAGMLLKETLLGARIFAVFKPWQLPPEALAFVAVAMMAIPTAYTGASGIIIIAMGAVVYQELRRVGTRRQLALAVTAMTGSSGVVLRPCLLVIGIAMLNKEVVTDELFHWGNRVFMLTVMVFFFYVMITRQGKRPVAGWSDAFSPSMANLKKLLPYTLIFILLLLAYRILLDAQLDEFSAPIMLPIIILAILFYEKKKKPADSPAPMSTSGMRPALSLSIRNASVQIGALLVVMACSYAVGGIIERGGGVMTIPDTFESNYAAMLFLVFFLIIIGMIMDPFGALILVSSTIAPIAYKSGINPIHFWMTCLVAFELGYLSPPVSLNHLLTRQVVGDKEVTLAMEEGHNFYYRHERLLLPLMVMGTTLVIVAFGPLIYQNTI